MLGLVQATRASAGLHSRPRGARDGRKNTICRSHIVAKPEYGPFHKVTVERGMRQGLLCVLCVRSSVVLFFFNVQLQVITLLA